jgi:hypothetical protein
MNCNVTEEMHLKAIIAKEAKRNIRANVAEELPSVGRQEQQVFPTQEHPFLLVYNLRRISSVVTKDIAKLV